MSIPSTVEEYIADFPEETQAKLNEVRKTILGVVPDAREVIAYGIPTYKMFGKAVVHFGGYKSHVGFYATPTGHKAFEEDLKPYKQGKGSVQFPLNEPMPLELIERIVEFRLEQEEKKAKARAKKK